MLSKGFFPRVVKSRYCVVKGEYILIFFLRNYDRFHFIEHSVSGDDFTYEIKLDGTSDQCVDGVVCLKQKEKNRRVLGTYSSRKFYIDGRSGRFLVLRNIYCIYRSTNTKKKRRVHKICNIIILFLGLE